MTGIALIIIDADKYCNTLTNLGHVTETIKTEGRNSKCAILIKNHIAQIPLN